MAEKILNRAKALPTLEPPVDSSVTTLYLGNLGTAGLISEKDLRDHFYQFGDIRDLRLLETKQCAFITFTTREAAEIAAERSFKKLNLKVRTAIDWFDTNVSGPECGYSLGSAASSEVCRNVESSYGSRSFHS